MLLIIFMVTREKIYRIHTKRNEKWIKNCHYKDQGNTKVGSDGENEGQKSYKIHKSQKNKMARG